MKAGAQIAFVDAKAVVRRGIALYQPLLGDPNDAAPAALPAPYFFAASKETEDSGRYGDDQGPAPGDAFDRSGPDDRRRGHTHIVFNVLLLVGAAIVGVVFIGRLLETFGQVISPFR